MITATVTDFRKNIKDYLERVTSNLEALVINRGKDSGVVVLSLEEYNRLMKGQYSLLNEDALDATAEKLASDQRFQKILFEKGIEKLSAGKEQFEFLQEDTDWWDNLSESQIAGIKRGVKDFEEGRFLSHEEVAVKYGL